MTILVKGTQSENVVGCEDEESISLLFPSFRSKVKYKDFHGPKYGTAAPSQNDAKFSPAKEKSGAYSKFKEILVKWIELLQQSCRRYLGILLAIFASFLLSLTTLIAHELIEYHPFNAALWRFLGILIPSMLILLWTNLCRKEQVFGRVYPCSDPDKLKTFLLIFVRAFCGCTAVIFQFYSLNYLEIGDVTVISFTSPVFVAILAYFFLGEPLGLVPVINALVTLLGICIIARPPILSETESFDAINLIGVALALGCMTFASFTYVALRWLKSVHYSLVTFFYGLISIIECGICALTIGVIQLPHTLEHWLLAVALGGLAFGGQTMFTFALKFEDAGPVALIRTCEVIFTFVWQIMFLGQIPDAFSVIGAVLILLSVLVTTLRKLVMELPDESPVKTRFRFLLK